MMLGCMSGFTAADDVDVMAGSDAEITGIVGCVVDAFGGDGSSSGGFRFSVILFPLPVYITEYI